MTPRFPDPDKQKWGEVPNGAVEAASWLIVWAHCEEKVACPGLTPEVGWPRRFDL